jgi:hypothetical protein
MSINYEIKGMLARLLATEDLIVEHKKVETACFNVQTRVLTLPMWEKASNTVYDMLVAHEVSHALYTPNEDWTDKIKVPLQFVNIVEDARVEKLIKRRYMGLSKTFYTAYKELHKDDFFLIGDDDVAEFNFADRVNLYFKVGNFMELSFTERETEIIDLIAKVESFDEVLSCAQILYDYCKEEEKQKQTEDNEQNNPTSGSGEHKVDQSEQNQNQDFDSESEQLGNTPFENDELKDDENKLQNTNNPSSISEDKLEDNIRTIESLEKSIEKLIGNSTFSDTSYIEIPKLNLDTVVISNNEIYDYINVEFAKQIQLHDYINVEFAKQIQLHDDTDIFEVPDMEYNKFKSSTQKEVNYMVKEFECHKSADSYARATTSKTGILDCTKLHTYKYNQDLFKKVTVLHEGKNHGLVFILDWSGSMANVMMDTIKQLYNLIWFCKKVGIPFEVYAFTGEWIYTKYDDNNKPIFPKSHYEKKAGLFVVDEVFSLLNFFTSKNNNQTIDKQMKNLWRVAYSFRGYCNYNHPNKLSLSGTPLNESLIALHQILPKFQKENKLQKLQCVILTDGEANVLTHHQEVKRNRESETYIGIRAFYPDNSFLRDRKTGNTYKLSRDYTDFSNILLKNLRDNFPYINFIGMRILESRDAGAFIRKSLGYHDDKIMNEWKKNRSFCISTPGYTKYFGLSSSVLSNDVEFEVGEDATKTQIKSAFSKSLRSKKLNKKILGEFISLIS